MIPGYTFDKSTAISRMNFLGSGHVPFLFIIDYKFRNPVVIPLSEIDPGEILYQVDAYTNFEGNAILPGPLLFEANPEDFKVYEPKFGNIITHLRLGNTYLANLTCRTRVVCNYSLSEIFAVSKARFKLCLKDRFVLFSPEIFVTISNGVISSFPMKGTIDALAPEAAATILHDPKETAEHYTIVDLIRNDLSQVAKRVRVEKFRYIDRIGTSKGPILQVSSHISGMLETGFEKRLGDIFLKLLPAGSVTGAPKAKTVAILDETEGFERGYYTGVFGIFDGINLTSAVMIRFLEKSSEGYFYKSGGGITTSSEAEKEYREMIKKIYVPVD